jgi:hypothetical protein
MRAATLAAIIERDLLRTEPTRTSHAAECFTCGRPFMPRPSTGDCNVHRFCSARCREGYDDGFPAYRNRGVDVFDVPMSAWRVVAGPPGIVQYEPLAGSRQLSGGMKGRGTHGFLINCACCGGSFDSKGLRCCSTECERRYRDHSENDNLIAEVRMAPPVRRQCAREGCGRNIPTWRNGRRVSKATRFCSDGCRSRHAKASKNPDRASKGRRDVFPRETHKRTA